MAHQLTPLILNYISFVFLMSKLLNTTWKTLNHEHLLYKSRFTFFTQQEQTILYFTQGNQNRVKNVCI